MQITKTYSQLNPERRYQLAALFKDREFKKDQWLRAIKADFLAWNQVSDLRGWQNATSSQYGIRAIPSNLLINKEGIIVAKNVFGEKLKQH